MLTVPSGSRASPALTELRHRRGGRAHAEARAQLLGTSAAGETGNAEMSSGGEGVEQGTQSQWGSSGWMIGSWLFELCETVGETVQLVCIVTFKAYVF